MPVSHIGPVTNADQFEKCCFHSQYYCFVTADLNAIARASWVDESARGSDHQPLWVELETG